MGVRYEANGQEVIRVVDGISRHYADAISPVAANKIAGALNDSQAREAVDAIRNSQGPIPVRRSGSHIVERQGDEWACSCGARWDFGEDYHP